MTDQTDVRRLHHKPMVIIDPATLAVAADVASVVSAVVAVVGFFRDGRWQGLVMDKLDRIEGLLTQVVDVLEQLKVLVDRRPREEFRSYISTTILANIAIYQVILPALRRGNSDARRRASELLAQVQRANRQAFFYGPALAHTVGLGMILEQDLMYWCREGLGSRKQARKQYDDYFAQQLAGQTSSPRPDLDGFAIDGALAAAESRLLRAEAEFEACLGEADEERKPVGNIAYGNRDVECTFEVFETRGFEGSHSIDEDGGVRGEFWSEVEPDGGCYRVPRSYHLARADSKARRTPPASSSFGYGLIARRLQGIPRISAPAVLKSNTASDRDDLSARGLAATIGAVNVRGNLDWPELPRELQRYVDRANNWTNTSNGIIERINRELETIAALRDTKEAISKFRDVCNRFETIGRTARRKS